MRCFLLGWIVFFGGCEQVSTIEKAVCEAQVFDDDDDGFFGWTSHMEGGRCVTTNDGEDCDDQNSAINPDATEICENGIDDNCDAYLDDVSCVYPGGDSGGDTGGDSGI